MSYPEPSITVNVDLTNPGQFFACCGLLELADRLWRGAKGWFNENGEVFHLASTQTGSANAKTFLEVLGGCEIASSMTDEQTARLKKLKNLNKKFRTPETDAETTLLNELWERERILIGSPFDLWLDWWNDEHAGGSSLKTWAGKQFISDLVGNLHAPLSKSQWNDLEPIRWLTESVADGRLPLYFDSDIGGSASSIDVGYSLDALDMRSSIRPMLELLAFIGLQRFRPQPIMDKEIYRYSTWPCPLPPILASAVCCGAYSVEESRRFKYRLLYRTKYLKSFLPAISIH